MHWAGTNTPAETVSVQESGILSVAGGSAYYVDFLSTTDDGPVQVTSITWQGDSETYFLTLSVYGNGEASDRIVELRDTVKAVASSFESPVLTPTPVAGLTTALRTESTPKPEGQSIPALTTSSFLTLPAQVPLNVQQGWWYHPVDGGERHCAIDFIDTPIGQPATAFAVVASADGWATNVNPGQYNGGLGTYVLIRHEGVGGQTYYTTYAHLQSSNLPADQETFVTRGQQIGVTGSTGNTGGYRHLHFVLNTQAYSSCGASTTRLDPYDIYQNRDYYPTPCGANYAWLVCPPTGSGGVCITPTTPYPDGSLWRMEGDTAIYVMYGQTRYWIHNPTDFTNMGFHEEDVQCATAGSLVNINGVPYDKTLIREFGDTGIYVVDCTARFLVPDPGVLDIMVGNGYANWPWYDLPPGERDLRTGTVPYNGCRMQVYGDPALWLTCPDPSRKWHMSPYAWSIFAALDGNVRVLWPGALDSMTELDKRALRNCPDTDGESWSELSEDFMGADRSLPCPRTTIRNDERGPDYSEPRSPWPPDLDDNRIINLQDLGRFNGLFGSRGAGAPVQSQTGSRYKRPHQLAGHRRLQPHLWSHLHTVARLIDHASR